MNWVATRPASGATTAAICGFALSVTILFAAVAHHYWDEPLRRRLNALITKR
jgi:peptidoglycan/LPS O-acetylase OafA/YrhL